MRNKFFKIFVSLHFLFTIILLFIALGDAQIRNHEMFPWLTTVFFSIFFLLFEIIFLIISIKLKIKNRNKIFIYLFLMFFIISLVILSVVPALILYSNHQAANIKKQAFLNDDVNMCEEIEKGIKFYYKNSSYNLFNCYSPIIMEFVVKSIIDSKTSVVCLDKYNNNNFEKECLDYFGNIEKGIKTNTLPPAIRARIQ